MLPKRVVFAANATTSTGAGHVMRLFEISKGLPDSIEKHFVGSVDLPWVKELLGQHFSAQFSRLDESFGRHDIVLVDSYDGVFCEKVAVRSLDSTLIQVADRYTPLLPKSLIIFMDLPFGIKNEGVKQRTIAHGIEFLPIRDLNLLGKQIKPSAKKVLVSTGGSVNWRIFSQLIDELAKEMYQGIEFHFVGIPNNLVQTNANLIFHDFGIGFDLIARDCDTAISTAGTTMWSLLANNFIVGLAAIVENQKENYSFAINSKSALPLFAGDNIKLDVGVLKELLFDETSRHNLRKAILGKYDTLGASRVCDLLIKIYQESFHTRRPNLIDDVASKEHSN
jgi:spore coat polysaccharide biosynthesis predicted glycosyltransferase SpsG